MNDKTDPNEHAPDIAALLRFLEEAAEGIPEDTVFIIHPANYSRIARSVDRILAVIREAAPDATHAIEFDPLIGTGLCLRVRAWIYCFPDCKAFAEAAALADYMETEALVSGETVFSFGFEDARIRVPEAEKDLLENPSESCYNSDWTQPFDENKIGRSYPMFDDERNDCYEEDIFLSEDDDLSDDWNTEADEDVGFNVPVDEDEEMEQILWDEDLESDLFGDD
ncbi:MAG: hypothetical protein J6Z04_05920 [Clostridia bacterium]|nr:hypothetical protein [Clostridia bacterium]